VAGSNFTPISVNTETLYYSHAPHRLDVCSTSHMADAEAII